MIFDADKLNQVLIAHGSWVRNEPGGVRADLYGADLSEANLYGANLYRADLYRADLREADLYGANLRGANLSGADLYGANLRGADLSGANLRGANLRRANLRGANLRGANLRGANLYRVNLRGADLYRADLSGADLRGANLYGWKIGKAEGNPLLSLSFDHGWTLQLIHHEKGIGIICGCRRFETRAEAQKYWKAHADKQRRTVVLPALDALFVIAKAQGWPVK